MKVLKRPILKIQYENLIYLYSCNVVSILVGKVKASVIHNEGFERPLDVMVGCRGWVDKSTELKL